MNHKKSKSKQNLVLALYRVLTENSKVDVVAVDYPPRSFKKSADALLKFLKEKNIQAERTTAEWPHFTISYIPPISDEFREKIKLAAPAYLSRITTTDLCLLVGDKFPKIYIAWNLKIEKEESIKKLINWIYDESDTTPKYTEFKPHASLVQLDKSYLSEVEKLLPAMYEEIKQFKISYKPEQIQFWRDMHIYDIHDAAFK